MRRADDTTLVSCLDGKTLHVGSRSYDRDARHKGPYGAGYKLHAIWGGQPVAGAWKVMGGGVGEAPVAEPHVRHSDAGGYLVDDSNYDSRTMLDEEE